MDFDLAAKRLARDQSKLKSKQQIRGGSALSVQAKREAERAKHQAEQRAALKRKQNLQRDYQEEYMRTCRRKLGVKSLSTTKRSNSGEAAESAGVLLLQPTSIHGQGDKIALPPSILEYLAQSQEAGSAPSSGPWTFRIGLLNPQYSFPASPLLQNLNPPEENGWNESVDGDDSDSEDADDDENERGGGSGSTEAYLDELRYKYLAYTHSTVVEFTQEEGYVGLPEPIAKALIESAATNTAKLDPSKRITTMRTVDPAQSTSREAIPEDSVMDVEQHESLAPEETTMVMDDDEKTPGHLAWGAFDLPNMPIEVSMVQLPRGKACTLVPTDQAIQNGFYNLNDIKLVLEQSLIRTRATLTVGDVVHTWHRGTKFDLTVTSVKPSAFNAVLCINTDIEVEFGSNPTYSETKVENSPVAVNDSAGRLLSSAGSLNRSLPPTGGPTPSMSPQPDAGPLLPEPDVNQTAGVCLIQIQAGLVAISRDRSRRRFDVHKANVRDVFHFARSLLVAGDAEPMSLNDFRLVTRFPRRVLTMEMASSTLVEAGLQAGQELLMVEKIDR